MSLLHQLSKLTHAKHRHHYQKKYGHLTDQNLAKVGAQRAQSQYGLPYRPTIPRIVLTEKLGQSLVRRGMRPPDSQPNVQFRERLRKERLPLLGLKSQRESKALIAWRVLKQAKQAYRVLQDPLRRMPLTATLCKRRSERREYLFRIKVAGFGRRRSPGAGGSYRRTLDSSYSCVSYRR